MDLEKGVSSDGTAFEGTPLPGLGATSSRGVDPLAPKIFVPAGYQPKYRVGHNGTLICHDPLLSVSPEALTEFLTIQATTPPTPTISIIGSHQETRVETYYTTVNGRSEMRTRTVTVTITDFSASYSLAKEVEAGLGYAQEGLARAVMYTQGEWDLAFRGSNKKERKAGTGVDMTRDERKQLEADWKARKWHGMAPFVHPASLVDITSDIAVTGPQAPSAFPPGHHPARLFQGQFLDLVEDHSVAPFQLQPYWGRYQPILADRDARRSEIEQVARDFCASNKSMKELHVKKQTYGWDWEKVEQDLTRIIRSTGYSTSVSVQHSTPSKCDIMIRPDSAVGRIFSARWYWKVLLWLLLVYPILLIVEKLVGARYTSIRVAFPLCRWRALPPSYAGAPQPATVDEAAAIAAPLGGGYRFPKVAQLPTDGTWMYLVGLEEQDWIQSVEAKLRNVVTGRMHGVDLAA